MQTRIMHGTAWRRELTSLRDAIWEAINGIEEKAAHAPIACELETLDRIGETLGQYYAKDRKPVQDARQQLKVRRW